MKKIKCISLALFFGLFCVALPFSSSAQTVKTIDAENTFSYVQNLLDGRYMVVTVSQTPQKSSSNLMSTMSAASTVSGAKTMHVYGSDNVEIFSWTVHGTFSYVYGSSSTCTASSYTYTESNYAWHFTSGSASYSGNTASADGNFKRYFLFLVVGNQDVTSTLSCNVYGNLG